MVRLSYATYPVDEGMLTMSTRIQAVFCFYHKAIFELDCLLTNLRCTSILVNSQLLVWVFSSTLPFIDLHIFFISLSDVKSAISSRHKQGTEHPAKIKYF